MNIAILLAAGRSRRFGSDKLFEKLGEKTVFEYSLQFLEDAPQVSKIFIAANAANKKKIEKIAAAGSYKKNAGIVLGGKTRFQSVQNCLSRIPLSKIHGPFIIHNAANPLATQEELTRCLRALRQKNIYGAGVGRPITSTLKLAPKGQVKKTLSRSNIWEMETPQAVRAKEFSDVILSASEGSPHFTDDLSVLEAAGFNTSIVSASSRNRKITTPEDLEIARALVERSAETSSVGIGEDSHKFSAQKDGKNLVLGGVKFFEFPPLQADSDGDVILHALCNALASSLGRGSLGTYATKMCRRGIKDSRQYLKKNLKALQRAHRTVQHAAFSIEAAQPSIDPIAPKIKKSLSALLKIPESAIGLTATTGKNVTPFGRGKAIKCQAIVLLQSVRIQK